MPKVLAYTLAWCHKHAAYELYETQTRNALPITPDSPAWFAWLETVPSFAFVGKHGRYTARKEARQQSECYWYAYQTQGKCLRKKYLGKAPHITLALLESLAEEFAAQWNQQHPLTVDNNRDLLHENGEVPALPASSLQHAPLLPLLQTKLHMPHLRPHLVVRPHLVERLQQSAQFPLTLISAPAGFGKTTLLAQWLSQSHVPVAWLSLDSDDNDPARFLPHLIAALQRLEPQLGATSLALLRTPQPPSPEIILEQLINDVVEYNDKDKVLVLDDYHVITNISLQRGMSFLLEHLPPSLHLILATRTDPPWPLARLRARGYLSKIGASDLRFASHEARCFLRTVMNLELSTEALEILEDRTEGWIAGLQLAGLSLQGRNDVDSFLTSLSETPRFVLDYLSEEVLKQQKPTIQEFLLFTSLLDRLSGPLCDAVTGRKGSQKILEMLEQANLFVIALDEIQGWYRYHHLFAEGLHSQLQQRAPTLIPTLHRRAIDWYERHGFPFEAIHHALAIPDEECAIRLIEPIVIPFAVRGQRSTVLEWFKMLRETVVHAHPLLCVYYSSLLLLTNQFDAAEVLLQEVEAKMGEELPAEQARFIQGYIFTNRSTIAYFSGDLSHSIPLAHQALRLLPKTEELAYTGNLINVTHSYLLSGDTTPAAEQAVRETVASIRPLSNPFATVCGIALLAHLQMLRGQLRQAATTYAQVLQIGSPSEMLQTRFAGPYYYFGLGNLFREWNDLEAAEKHLRQGMDLIHAEVPLEAYVILQG
ncbi:MAG: hypothetical protein J2P36_11125, partial [Ktedonobacteraceae bacterium]|nr:hypothetical protein [Ktedonobacteraceae bacterium]